MPEALTLDAGALPERANVYWRAPVDESSLRRTGWWWTLTALAHSAPFLLGAALLVWLKPVTSPLAAVLLIHAWVIPELYAARGANVLRPRRKTGTGWAAVAPPERRALLLLGDLVGPEARSLHEASGLVMEGGRLGTWVLGEGGALLVRPGGRRVNCYCVAVTDSDLPHGDRIAHLLLALRCDETGFATVANLAFSGACWRLRRRLGSEQRLAFDAARATAAASR